MLAISSWAFALAWQAGDNELYWSLDSLDLNFETLKTPPQNVHRHQRGEQLSLCQLRRVVGLCSACRCLLADEIRHPRQGPALRRAQDGTQP